MANPPIGESSRLISDFLEISNKSKINRYLVTADIEKKFNSLDHDFVITAIEKFGFKSSFIDWIKIFLKEIEKTIAAADKNKLKRYNMKWFCVRLTINLYLPWEGGFWCNYFSLPFFSIFSTQGILIFTPRLLIIGESFQSRQTF